VLSGRRFWLSIATRHVAKLAKMEALAAGLAAWRQGSHGLGPWVMGLAPQEPRDS
jgi:hypothetical protein